MTTRRLLALLAAPLVIGAALHYWPIRSVPVPTNPVVGTLSPYRPELAGPWEEVARIPAGALGRGVLTDLDERGDTLYLLQSNHWMRIVRGVPSSAFGSRATGSPSWLAGGAAIRAVPGGVIILDRVRQVLGEWTPDGVRHGERDLKARRVGAAMVEGLAVDTTGEFFIATRGVDAGFGGRWMLLRGRMGDVRTDTVFHGRDTAQEGDIHDMPRTVAAGDGSLLVMPSIGWKIFRVDSRGRVVDSAVRRDGPRWPVPDSARRRYARILERLPPAQRRAYAVTTTLPAIRGMTRDASGRLIVLVGTDLEAAHVEILSSAGEPAGRLWENPETRATFVANGAVFRIGDADGFTRIERQRILSPRN